MLSKLSGLFLRRLLRLGQGSSFEPKDQLTMSVTQENSKKTLAHGFCKNIPASKNLIKTATIHCINLLNHEKA